MHNFFTLDIQMSICLNFIETSQTIIAVHHTSIQLSLGHRNKTIGR